MFGRRKDREHAEGAHPRPARYPKSENLIGIGARVFIRPGAGGPDAWDGEPSGVVIAPGDSELISYPGLNFGANTRWLVAFDELAYMTDGRGPFEQASVPGWQLAAISVLDEAALTERDADDR